MSGRSRNDYTEAERLYVVEGKSYRSVATICGMSWSAVSAHANAHDWKGKRQAYLNAIARRSYENIAESVAHETSEVRKEAVLAGRATVRKYLNDLANGKITITSKDAHLWASFLLAEMTASHTETSSEVPNVRNVSPPDTELLRRVVEAARGRVAATGDLGAIALVEPSDTRPN